MAFGNVPPSDALFDDYMSLGEWAKQINRLILKYGHSREFMYSSLGPELGNVAPAVVSVITATGVEEAGSVLSLTGNSWYGAPTFDYTWLRDGEAIGGAKSATYTVSVEDEGFDVSCHIIATNHFGSTTVTTNAITIAITPP